MGTIITKLASADSAIGTQRTLAQFAIPIALVPSGTVAANGTITLNTALAQIYSSGIWIRLPAGAIAGAPSGLYWATFTSTTVGQVTTTFADVSLPFTPYIPAGPQVAAVGSSAAYTQTTATYISVCNITIPGGAMGLNGSITVTALGNRVGTGATAVPGILLGGTDPASTVSIGTGSAMWGMRRTIFNRGSMAQQVTAAYANDGSTGTLTSFVMAKNTAADLALNFILDINNAQDGMVLDGLRIELVPG